MSENIFVDRPIKYQEPQADVNEAFMKMMSEGILLLDKQGVFQLANEAALKMLHLDRLVPQRFWDVFPDHHFGFSMQEALCYGISHHLIYTSLPSLELEVSTTFVHDRLLLFLRDLTHLKKLQRVATRTDRMSELGEMAAKLAHEIRNCLGGIRGFASLLHRDLSTEPHLQEMVQKIIEGSKSLEKLVTTVLVYARPMELKEQTVDLSQFLKQTALALKVDPDFPSNVKFNLHIPNEPLLLPLDTDSMKRALLNLLLNGAQAMPKGGELTLSLFKCDPNCQISVTDTGIGMDEAQLNALFSPLFTTKSNGNGLGLVETKKIVQGHGGSIAVRSLPNRGTTLSLTLPLRKYND